MSDSHVTPVVRSFMGVIAPAAVSAVVVAAVSSLLLAAPPPPREWRDYAGGPDSSRFVAATQITKGNVGQLQVAWTYPDGDTDFNPLVVRDVIYTRARGNTFVALDAATGAQRWASPPIEAFVVRGMNYWESADGTDRRLLLSHAEPAAGVRRQHRPADRELRQGRRGRSARRPRSRSRDRAAAEPTAGQDLRAPADPRLGHQRRVRLGPRRHPRLRRPHRRPCLVVPDHPAQGRVRRRHLAGRRARPRRRRQRLGRDVGRRRPRHRLRADRQRQVQLLRRLPPRRQPVLGQHRRPRRAHRQAALALPDRAPRHLGPGQQLGAAADDHHARAAARSTSSRWPARPAISTCSIASPASRSGRSRNVRCRRGPRCPASTCRRRSRSRPGRSRSRGSRSPSTT